MAKYYILVKLDQIVTKEIELSVNAESEEDAKEQARQAVQAYPDPVDTASVTRMRTLKSHYWIPKSIDIARVEVKDVQND